MSLHFLALGFDDSTSPTLSEMRFTFDSIVDGEIMELCSRASIATGAQETGARRRSSVLRSSGVIVSDTPVHYTPKGRFRAVGNAVMAMNKFFTGKGKSDDSKPQANDKADTKIEG